MYSISVINIICSKLPKVATAVVITLFLTAITCVDAANTSRMTMAALPLEISKQYLSADNIPDQMKVLSPKDVALYRAIFAAQSKRDWKTADMAMFNVKDKRLLGHILADRYQHRAATAEELRKWLTTYSDLPEADEIYEFARSQHDFVETSTKKPTSVDEWSGFNAYGNSLGFRIVANTNKPSSSVQRFANKIDGAIHHGDPYLAEALLETEKSRRTLSKDELNDVTGRIAASFFYEGRIEHAKKISSDAADTRSTLGAWIAGLSYWKENDPQKASFYFIQLAAEPGLSSWDKAAADFWAYRSLKKINNNSQANYYLKQAALQPHSFYGLLASQLLDRKTVWSWHIPEFKKQHVDELVNYPSGARALALIQIGRSDLAEAELRRINPVGQHNLQEAMLIVADMAGMPSLALQLGSLVSKNGKLYDAALYPVPPWHPEKGYDVDRALLFALMRHESQFDPTAISDRGACGLMQLMPTTARFASADLSSSKAHGTERAHDTQSCNDRLLDPSVNIEIGQNYVKQLANQPMIGNNLLLLLAAYNSGPGKLSRWVDDSVKHDPLLFIESLPVRETRDYVQQVMIQYWSYRARLSEPQTSLNQLAHNEWPRYILLEDAKDKVINQAAASEVFKVASYDNVQ